MVEEQDLVYRQPAAVSVAAAPAAIAPERREAHAVRSVTLDATALFRFSALTFNAHRIHYDRDYARDVEGYPDCLVHGPYQATLLIDHLRREMPDRVIREFRFRGERPLFVDQPFELNLLRDGDRIELWTSDRSGSVAMSAEAILG